MPMMRRNDRDAQRHVRFAELSDSSDDEELYEEAIHAARRVETLPLVLKWDLDAVRWIVRQRENSPMLEALIVSTTSRSRLHDITMLLWLVFLAMLPEFGLPYLWICLGNLLGVLALQYLAQVERPIDLDGSLLLAPSCTDPDTNGFPCVDSHMAIVVLLPVIEHTDNIAVQLVFIAIIVFISFTRLCLATRFISQTVGSWLSGLAGIILGNHGHLVIKAYRLPRIYHTVAFLSILAVILAVVSSWVENNDSRLLGVPRQDFMDVLTNIMQSGGAARASVDHSSAARVHQFPSQPTRPTESESEDQEDETAEIMGRKDSFFYLVQGMRKRQLEARRERRQRQAEATMRRAAPTHPRPYSI